MIAYILTAVIVIIAIIAFLMGHYLVSNVLPLRLCSDCH